LASGPRTVASAGPALSRSDRLLPIGSRADGGPALPLLTYINLHFLLKLLM